jgi:hypothetical protein
MALPLLAAARLLTAGTSRGALISAGKSIAKDKLLGGGKDKIKKDAKKTISTDEEKGRGGALVKVEKRSISVQKLLEKPERGGQLSKDITEGNVGKNKPRSLESLVKVIETIQKNINNITDILGKKKKFDDKKLLNKKKDVSEEKKKQREDELEEDKKEKSSEKRGGIGIQAPSFLDRVINFFSNILLGGLADFLLTNQQQVFKILDDIQNGLANNWKFASRLLIGFRKPITALASFAGKSLLNPLYLPTKALQASVNLTGKAVSTTFSALGSSIKNVVNLSVKSVASGSRFGLRAGTAAAGALRGGQGLRGATKAVGTAAKRSFRQATAPKPSTLKPSTPRGKGLNVLNKPGAIAAKGFFRRIPILGPILIGVASLMAGEPVNQSLFKAGGAALGGALGSFIPIPILGTMLGEFIGEFVGDIFYELILGKGISGAKTKLWNGIKKALDVGGVALNWVKRGSKKYIDNWPKYKIPNPGFPGIIKNALEWSVGWKRSMKGLQDFLGGHPWSPFKIVADNQWFGNKKGKLSQLPDPTFQFRDPLGFLKHIKNSFFDMPKNPPKEKLADLEPLENTEGGRGGRPESPQIEGATPQGTVTSLGSGGGSLKNMSEQDWSDLAYIVSGEAARGTDDEYGVAAAVLTRVADPNWPNTIMGVGTQADQFEAVYKGLARRDPALAKKLKQNQGKIIEALKVLNGRTDFKGQSQLKNKGAGDPMFHPRGNFYHYTSQRKVTDPAPANPPQHWKKWLSGGVSLAQNQQQSNAVAQQAASSQVATDKNETRISEPAMLKGRDTKSQDSTAQLAPQQSAASKSSMMTQSISQSSQAGRSGLVPLPPTVIPIGGGSQPTGQPSLPGGYSMSKQEMLNNYYQSQLIGFLYKQG